MCRACSRTTSSTSRPSAKCSPRRSRASSGATSRRAARSCCSRAACGCRHASRPGPRRTKVTRRTSARATSLAPWRWWPCAGSRAGCGAPLRRPPRSDAPSWAPCSWSSPASWASRSPPGRSLWHWRSPCTRWSGAARGTRTMADLPLPPQPARQVARIAQQDEADLVARAVAGERAAFGTLVERYAGVARPDTTTERRALNERLRQALAELPERRRMAVVLFDVEGYSHGEIALILGIPEGTVRSEVFHARRRLRVLLADWKEEG